MPLSHFQPLVRDFESIKPFLAARVKLETPKLKIMTEYRGLDCCGLSQGSPDSTFVDKTLKRPIMRRLARPLLVVHEEITRDGNAVRVGNFFVLAS